MITIHPTAEVAGDVQIGEGTQIWHQAQIRERVRIGSNCVIGKGVYIDAGIHIGDNVKIQNYGALFHGITVGNGVFIGPHVCFTNDLYPRAVTPEGSLKSASDWEVALTVICDGASLGANTTIVCGITIGKWAMVGAGSVVTHDIPDNGLVWGNPARLRGFVCACGRRLAPAVSAHDESIDTIEMFCTECGRAAAIPKASYERIGGANV
jgi:UDP-2-acetamido-3-amino-2,3-dideoxy-glucuronate N-acetyltransferase